MDETNGRLNTTEETMYLVINQEKSSKMRHNEKKDFLNEQIQNDLRDGIKWSNTILIIVLYRKKRENEEEKIVEETLPEKFSNLV